MCKHLHGMLWKVSYEFSMTYGLLVLYFRCSPDLKWKSLRLLCDTQLSTKVDNTMVCDTYHGTTIPWYGCLDLARKHDPLEFISPKILEDPRWKWDAKMTWLASESTQHDFFLTKKNPLDIFHDRQFPRFRIKNQWAVYGGDSSGFCQSFIKVILKKPAGRRSKYL